MIRCVAVRKKVIFIQYWEDGYIGEMMSFRHGKKNCLWTKMDPYEYLPGDIELENLQASETKP
jgi:hypothetical protein